MTAAPVLLEPVDIGDAGHARRRLSERRLARELLLSAIYLEIPSFARHRSPLCAALAWMEGVRYFLVSPKLTRFEVKLAAWGLACRARRDDEYDGLHLTALRRARGSLERRLRDPEAALDRMLGISPEGPIEEQG
jgi:hypothetical protein